MAVVSTTQNRENSHDVSMCKQSVVQASHVMETVLQARKPAGSRSFRQMSIRSANNDRLKFYSGSHCKY